MKKLIKNVLALCWKPILWFGMLLPAKCKNEVKLKKYQKEMADLRKPESYLSKKYHNNLIDDEVDLSIIVPIYNVEKYLKECIDSILNNKTKYNIEVIAIDDGSTDGSLKILKYYKDKRLKVISTKNSGLSSARNIGLDHAVGKFVTFVDSDDYLAEDFVEVMMSAMLLNGADVVRAGYYVLKGNEIAEVRAQGVVSTSGLENHVLQCSGFAWGAIFKRELFYDVRFPVGYIFEDMIIRPLILSRAKVYVEIDRCVYYYRQRNGSILHQVNSMSDDRCLDQYYLPIQIYNYGTKIDVDTDILSLVLFRELGLISHMRLKKMNKNIKKGVFKLGAEFVRRLAVCENNLTDDVDKYYLKSFRKRNYFLYELVSVYARCKK